MFKLILYEWKKLLKNASFYKFSLFFLILSAILFYSEISSSIELIPTYQQYHEKLDQMPIDQSKEWIDKQSINYDLERDEIVSLEVISNEINAIISYPKYREAIQNRYEQSQGISIFADTNTNQQYMKKIADKYEQLELSNELRLAPYLGINTFLNHYISDILGIVFLIYLGMSIFISEIKQEKLAFLDTTMQGRGKLLFAKLITMMGSIIIYTMLVWMIELLMIWMLYGTIPLDAPIQSLANYYAVPYDLTILQYLFALFGLKIVAFILLSTIILLLSKWLKNELKVSIVFIVILIIAAIATSLIGNQHFIAMFGLWNPWAYLRGLSIISSYELINLGIGYISSEWGIMVIIMISIAIISFSIIHKWKESNNSRIVIKRSDKKPHGVLFYEMKKTWIIQGGLILFIGYIAITMYSTYQYQIRLDSDEYIYNSYVDKIGNHIHDKTDEMIKKEQAVFDDLRQQLTSETNSIKAIEINEQLNKENGFYMYQQRVEQIRKDHRDNYVLKDGYYKLLFQSSSLSNLMVVLLASAIAFLIPAIFDKEKSSGVLTLQSLNVDGKHQAYRGKLLSMIIYTNSFIIIGNILRLIKVIGKYDINYFATTNCLPYYWNSGIELPIIVTFIIGMILQCLIITSIVVIVAWLSKHMKNQFVLTGTLLGIIVVPTFISQYLYMPLLSYFHDLVFVFTNQQLALIGLSVIMVIASLIIYRKEMKT